MLNITRSFPQMEALVYRHRKSAVRRKASFDLQGTSPVCKVVFQEMGGFGNSHRYEVGIYLLSVCHVSGILTA